MQSNIIHHRKSIRLKGYDYSYPGGYFVTINTYHHDHLFGEIVNEEMKLNKAGEIAKECWIETAKHFSNVEIDEYIIMPNHMHGIFMITDSWDLINQIPRGANYPLMANPKNTLGKIIRYYKARTSKLIHDNGISNFAWQSLFYDRIIRDDKELDRIREYIAYNVLKWLSQKENRYY